MQNKEKRRKEIWNYDKCKKYLDYVNENYGKDYLKLLKTRKEKNTNIL